MQLILYSSIVSMNIKLRTTRHYKTHTYIQIYILHLHFLGGPIQICGGPIRINGGPIRISGGPIRISGGTTVAVTNGCEKYNRIIIIKYKHTTKLPVYISPIFLRNINFPV